MNKRNILVFIIIITLACMMCFPYLTMHYSTDTYTIIGDGYENYAIHTFLNAGRIFSSIMTWGAGYFQMPISIFVQILFYIGIFLSCLCVMEIQKILLQIKPELNPWKEIIILVISYSIIFNFMYLENMYFVEIPIMAVGLLLFMKSAQYLIKEQYVKSMVFLLLGELCYQGTINFFITFTFVLLMIQQKQINRLVMKKMLYACVFCIIAVVINILQIKICGTILQMEQTRLGFIAQIPNHILYIFTHLDKILIQSSDIFPRYWFALFFMLLLGILGFYQHQKKETPILIPVLSITIVAIVSSVAINIFSLSSFGLGRMVFSVGALIGLIFMYVYATTNVWEETGIIKYLLTGFLIIYFLMNFLNYTYLMYRNKQAIALDKREANQINQYITTYEKESGNQVKYIAITYDKDVTWCHKELKHESLFTHRGLMIWWCNVQALNYYTGRNLEQVNMTKDIYDEYFKGKDWDVLSEEQIICIEDTVYYCVY